MTKAKFFDDVTIDKVLDAYKRLDYPLFVNGDFNMILILISSVYEIMRMWQIRLMT